MLSLRRGRNRDQTEANREAGRNRHWKDPRVPTGHTNGSNSLNSLDDS